jgi:PAS domain-containing protein
VPSSIGGRLEAGDASIFIELFDLLAEAVTIRDLSGELVYANRAALARLGFESLEQLRTRSTAAIMDDFHRCG